MEYREECNTIMLDLEKYEEDNMGLNGGLHIYIALLLAENQGEWIWVSPYS